MSVRRSSSLLGAAWPSSAASRSYSVSGIFASIIYMLSSASSNCPFPALPQWTRSPPHGPRLPQAPREPLSYTRYQQPVLQRPLEPKQYHSRAYRKTLRRLEIRQSTSRTGSCLDGAAAESFFATIKTESGIEAWPDRASARRDIESWITSYNERRLHSALDYKTPTKTRRAWQDRMTTPA